MILESSWDEFGIILPSFDDHFGIMLGSCLAPFCMMEVPFLGSCWDLFLDQVGVILVSFCINSAVMLVYVTLGQFWDHFGIIFGSCSNMFGSL